MDYAALKADDTGGDLVTALAAAQVMTVTLAGAPVAWATIKAVARTAQTGDWSRIVVRSRMTPALPPATAADAAIMAAINAVQQDDSSVIDPMNEATWEAFEAGLTVLKSSGDLAQTTFDAINALFEPRQVPKYPGVTAGDIQTARAQP